MQQGSSAAVMSDGRGNQAERLAELYRLMLRIRCFEEAAETALHAGQVTGAIHLSIGQEAVAAGVCTNLRRDDVIASTHRGHGHSIAKGADLDGMMAELFGRTTGVCGGKGGSMHIADFSVGMLGANGVVAAGIPIAVGAAQGLRLKKSSAIAVAFFGDGATNRGPFLEALNWAAVFRLPVLFVCEDNGFAATTRTRAVTAGPGPSARAEALGVPALDIDGNDIELVDRVAYDLIAEIRAGGGPKFLRCDTYRLKGHTAVDPAKYRDAAEVEAKQALDPILRCAGRLARLGFSAADLQTMLAEERRLIAAVVERAASAPWPEPAQAFRDIQDVGCPS